MNKEHEEDAYYAHMGHESLWHCLNRIEEKLDKLLEHQKEAKLWQEKGKDKAIKDTLITKTKDTFMG